MRKRCEAGRLRGTSYVLIRERYQDQFPHMTGERDGKAIRWFLEVEGVYVGAFDTKSQALRHVDPTV